MMQATNGDTVKVHYTARLENGRVISATKVGSIKRGEALCQRF
jgi:FKBP-type peptidyl-prolyl cis-trans isomerase 2